MPVFFPIKEYVSDFCSVYEWERGTAFIILTDFQIEFLDRVVTPFEVRNHKQNFRARGGPLLFIQL